MPVELLQNVERQVPILGHVRVSDNRFQDSGEVIGVLRTRDVCTQHRLVLGRGEIGEATHTVDDLPEIPHARELLLDR